jgi:lipopolysaccharide transport system permease protein
MFRLTLLGPLWLIIHVAMDIAGKTFIFGSVLNVRTPNEVPYIMFLLTGMLGWRLFQHTLTSGIKAFQRFRAIVRDLDFPLLIVPIAGTAQALVEFALYLGVLMAGFAYYWIKADNILFETGPQLLLVPLGLAGCLVLGWGLCCWLAPINYRARDVRFVLSYAIGFWLYLTPVVYPLSRLSGFPLLLAKLNPMAPMIEMIKYGLIGAGNIGFRFAAYGLGMAALTFASGLIFLNRVGPRVLREPAAIGTDDDDEEEEVL